MSELSTEMIERLLREATVARANAHAPYSDFAVGAAVLDSGGRIHSGCNVENASFGLGVCAERHAVAAAIAAGARIIEALVVVTATSPPATPCGACRQVMAEFGDFPVIIANLEGQRRATSVAELLPDAFGPETLGEDQE